MGSTGSPKGTLVLYCCLALLLPLVVIGKSCHKREIAVPHEILTGSLVCKVKLHKCLDFEDVVSAETNNTDFAVVRTDSHYAIYALKHVSMPGHPLPLEIILRDVNSKENTVLVNLVSENENVKTRFAREILKRTKRRWRPMPFTVQENYRGPLPYIVNQVQSDTQLQYDIVYSITGQGVDQTPLGLFRMDEKTGDLYITEIVDREQYASFQLMVYAKTVDGYSPEFPLDLMVLVEDDNDNAPVFTEQTFCAEVLEHSKAGTVVGRVNATDRDEPKSLHTILRYYLVRQIPPSPVMFTINPEYGIITTTSNMIDREVLDHYTLIIEVRDMDGRIGCLSSTGTMSITVLDNNDHAPAFTKQSYQTEVSENESGKVILRIPVVDNDLVNTPNWRAVFSITQGNEKGFFNITTDPKTNEGLLTVIKPINYEEDKRFLLQVGVANEVSLITPSGTKSKGLTTIPVTVIVLDVDEGPECQPRIKEVNLQENQTIGTLVTEYKAIDPETKNSNGIKYSKLSDPLNWVTVGDNGRISTAKVLDYEANEVPNHKYNMTFLATDQSGKTGTCTLVINLQDRDEHQPGLSRSAITICKMGRTSATVDIVDKDGSIDRSTYRVKLDDSKDPRLSAQWNVVQEGPSSIKIEDAGNNDNGEYSLPVQIVDQQGRISVDIVRILKCDCPDSLNCAEGRRGGSAALGGLAILIMVLSALLFAALMCLLTACLCGAGAGKGKLGFPDDAAQQNLIVTNTEAPGADVMDPNFKVPVHIIKPCVSGASAGGSYDQNGQEMHQIEQNLNQSTTKIREHLITAGGGGQTLQSIRGGGHQRIDSSRHTYSDWHSFMNTHIGDVETLHVWTK
ncbi:desmocollin-2-like isoform X2 [Hyperolius riggenbachi]|uniref:desmocollin-2-like isoform X2 n=1 Tax=Hyperolius riggenbachi TaxID=752182 RepID=UPI0035A365F1